MLVPLSVSLETEADEPPLLTENDVMVAHHQQTTLHIVGQFMNDPILTPSPSLSLCFSLGQRRGRGSGGERDGRCGCSGGGGILVALCHQLIHQQFPWQSHLQIMQTVLEERSLT